jgi:cobalt/nickel transport system permease protein
MIPPWLRETEQLTPVRDGGTFALRTLRALGGLLSRLRVQRGRAGKLRVPAVVKLLLLLGLILTLSLARHPILLLAIAALTLGYACLLPARELASVLKPALGAALLALVLFLPAMVLRPAGAGNNLIAVGKIFLSVTIVNLFNRRTPWNQITGALRKLRVPGVFVFVLDLTLKYIVLLGGLMVDLLTARGLRAVGRDRHPWRSVGGVMGVTFLRSAELSRETWEAMCCRGFTDDYRGL